MEYVQIGLAISSLILANITMKTLRIYPLMKKIYNLIRTKEEAKKDGKLTIKEKALLYDDIVDLTKESWSLLTGLLPNKTKIK